MKLLAPLLLVASISFAQNEIANYVEVSPNAASIPTHRNVEGGVVPASGLPFEVQNRKDEKYDAAEARATFAVSVDIVAREYHVTDVLRPHFVLILGSDIDDISWTQGKEWVGGEIRLRRWNKRLFRQGVIALTINELLKTENVLRLERRIDDQENAMIDVKNFASLMRIGRTFDVCRPEAKSRTNSFFRDSSAAPRRKELAAGQHLAPAVLSPVTYSPAFAQALCSLPSLPGTSVTGSSRNCQLVLP